MDILDIPFQWLIAIVLILTAAFVLLRGLQLPADFEDKEKVRSVLRKKVKELEKQHADPGKVKSET